MGTLDGGHSPHMVSCGLSISGRVVCGSDGNNQQAAAESPFECLPHGEHHAHCFPFFPFSFRHFSKGRQREERGGEATNNASLFE